LQVDYAGALWQGFLIAIAGFWEAFLRNPWPHLLIAAILAAGLFFRWATDRRRRARRWPKSRVAPTHLWWHALECAHGLLGGATAGHPRCLARARDLTNIELRRPDGLPSVAIELLEEVLEHTDRALDAAIVTAIAAGVSADDIENRIGHRVFRSEDLDGK
jgi:hypothetical protein